MKDIATFLLTLVLAHCTLAQSNLSEELESFDKIKAYDRINVTLVKSNKNKIILKGSDKDEAVVTVKKGLLKVKMEFGNQMDGSSVEAIVHYTNELTLIDANENAKITSEQVIKGNNVKIATQEAGKISLKVDVKNLITKSSSGGIITLTGKAESQEAIANAGGKIYNQDLKTDTTEASANAGGEIEINADNHVKVTARAGGSINVYGNPKTKDKNTLFGGKIRFN